MPPVTDPVVIRSILELDRPWTAYALADLTPGLFHHTTWYAHRDGGPAIVLVFGAFEIPILLAVGAVDEVVPLILEAEACLPAGRAIYFNSRPDLLPWLRAHHQIERLSEMLRMRLDPGVRSEADPAAIRIGRADLPNLLELYAEGGPRGESPEFFTPEMLDHGTYHALGEDGRFVAAAGTHVFAPEFGVAAIGNVYTRGDRRGRGLGGRVTRAVLAHLAVCDLATVVLNVAASNAVAIRVYERLGFHPYCRYHEIIAVPR